MEAADEDVMPHSEEGAFGNPSSAEDGAHGNVRQTEQITYQLKSAHRISISTNSRRQARSRRISGVGSPRRNEAGPYL